MHSYVDGNECIMTVIGVLDGGLRKSFGHFRERVNESQEGKGKKNRLSLML